MSFHNSLRWFIHITEIWLQIVSSNWCNFLPHMKQHLKMNTYRHKLLFYILYFSVSLTRFWIILFVSPLCCNKTIKSKIIFMCIHASECLFNISIEREKGGREEEIKHMFSWINILYILCETINISKRTINLHENWCFALLTNHHTNQFLHYYLWLWLSSNGNNKKVCLYAVHTETQSAAVIIDNLTKLY